MLCKIKTIKKFMKSRKKKLKSLILKKFAYSVSYFERLVLTSFTDQHTNTLDRATRGEAHCSTSCVERSDRLSGPVRPVAVQNDDDPTNVHPGGTPSGQARVGLP